MRGLEPTSEESLALANVPIRNWLQAFHKDRWQSLNVAGHIKCSCQIQQTNCKLRYIDVFGIFRYRSAMDHHSLSLTPHTTIFLFPWSCLFIKELSFIDEWRMFGYLNGKWISLSLLKVMVQIRDILTMTISRIPVEAIKSRVSAMQTTLFPSIPLRSWKPVHYWCRLIGKNQFKGRMQYKILLEFNCLLKKFKYFMANIFYIPKK